MTKFEINKIFNIKSDDKLNFMKDNEKIIIRERCFLNIGFKKAGKLIDYLPFNYPLLRLLGGDRLVLNPEKYIVSIIHIPGLRGNPARTYPVTAVGPNYPGTFEKYTASVINRWEEDNSSVEIERLSNDLKVLGLTWKVTARRINDTQVELQVGRLPLPARGGARDLVSIADVGFGVSQTLPILVALHAATPGQLVYLEQPEIHLHPRAQTAMAGVLASAAKRGVCVVVETHSDLLLLGIQTEVAKGNLPREAVKLHWFQRIKGQVPPDPDQLRDDAVASAT